MTLGIRIILFLDWIGQKGKYEKNPYWSGLILVCRDFFPYGDRDMRPMSFIKSTKVVSYD